MNYSGLLQQALEKRLGLFQLKDCNCFRICNGSGDAIDGLTIDYYAGFLLVQYYKESVWKDDTVIRKQLLILSKSMPVQIKGILLKNRVKTKETTDFGALRTSILISGDNPPKDFHVQQHGIKMNVDLVHGQNTGIFLDMREVRNSIKSLYPQGGAMLNLFCYTGMFSLHALHNGMQSAINIDTSKAVLKRAESNYQLNAQHCDKRDFIHGDAMTWVNKFTKLQKQFAFIVFDPPTFSRNKNKSFSVKNDYQDSLKTIDAIASKYILTSINTYSVTRQQYIDMHPKHWKNIFFKHEAGDFCYAKEPYLKVGLWEKK